MQNRSSTNNIILAIKEKYSQAAVHIDKPLPPKHNALTTHQQGQVGHNVEHQKHISYIIMLGIMEMKGMLEMSLSRGPHSTSVFMRGYSRRLIPATKPSSILRSPMIRGGKRNIELQAQAMTDLLLAEFHNNGNLLYYKVPHPTKTRPQDNSKPLTLSEKKRKEATLGRQRAHARAGTSEVNRSQWTTQPMASSTLHCIRLPEVLTEPLGEVAFTQPPDLELAMTNSMLDQKVAQIEATSLEDSGIHLSNASRTPTPMSLSTMLYYPMKSKVSRLLLSTRSPSSPSYQIIKPPVPSLTDSAFSQVLSPFQKRQRIGTTYNGNASGCKKDLLHASTAVVKVSAN
ncbi:hypothetical protein FOXYSP1_06787 [Fusarium oxysporum f. sp. phaseoli]